jgi:hypothetical protein
MFRGEDILVKCDCVENIVAMSILTYLNVSAVVDLYIEWSAIGMEYRNESSE